MIDIIGDFQETIDRCQNIITSYYLVEINLEKLEPICSQIVLGTGPRFVINDISKIHELRSVLRDIFGHWEDKFNHSFYSYGTISTWRPQDNNPFEIWLECPIEEFPEELKKPNCKWVETTNTQRDYRLVCDSENAA